MNGDEYCNWTIASETLLLRFLPGFVDWHARWKVTNLREYEEDSYAKKRRLEKWMEPSCKRRLAKNDGKDRIVLTQNS